MQECNGATLEALAADKEGYGANAKCANLATLLRDYYDPDGKAFCANLETVSQCNRRFVALWDLQAGRRCQGPGGACGRLPTHQASSLTEPCLAGVPRKGNRGPERVLQPRCW